MQEPGITEAAMRFAAAAAIYAAKSMTAIMFGGGADGLDDDSIDAILRGARG